MVKVKWIFFDVGSTLVDETEAYNHRIRDMVVGTDISFKEFDDKRIALSKQGFDGNSEAIKFFDLKKTPWHKEDEVPFVDAEETLKYLKECGYKLGIIANQSLGTAERLEKWGLIKYLDMIAASAELGVAKPDKEIFQRSFEIAKCEAAETVMVGDRLDNDIIPAKFLGMKTAWIRRGLAIHQSLKYGDCVADYFIDSLSDLKSIF